MSLVLKWNRQKGEEQKNSREGRRVINKECLSFSPSISQTQLPNGVQISWGSKSEGEKNLTPPPSFPLFFWLFDDDIRLC